MTFLVIKEQNFHLVVCSAGRLREEDWGEWKVQCTSNLVPRAFPLSNDIMTKPNDVIQKIEKTLNNTHTTTQKRTNNGFRSLYSSACASNLRPPPPPDFKNN